MKATLIGKQRKGNEPSTPIWKVGEYTQGYDLPIDRGGKIIDEIPCPICANSPIPEHYATVELHWVGGMGYIKHICCDRTGIWWRER